MKRILDFKNGLLKKNNADYWILGFLLISTFIHRLWYFVFHYNILIYNSDSVTNFADVDILHGVVDLYRTPVYPYLIKFFHFLSKAKFVGMIVYFQHLLSLLSVIPFYFAARKIINNRILTIAATVVYSNWTFLLLQNVNINPECLSLVGSTILLFLVIKYVETPKKYLAFLIPLFSFILIMVKPTYLISLVIVLLFFVVRYIILPGERKVLVWAFSGLFISIMAILGYCEMNARHNGDFTLSRIVLINSIGNVALSKTYKNSGDKDFITIIDTTRIKDKGHYNAAYLLDNKYVENYNHALKSFPSTLRPTTDMTFTSDIPDIENFSLDRVKNFVQKSQYSRSYMRYIKKRFINLFSDYILLFVAIIGTVVAMCYSYIKLGVIPWVSSFIILFILAQFFTVAVGGIEYIERLLMPNYPFIIILMFSFIGILVSFFYKKGFADKVI